MMYRSVEASLGTAEDHQIKFLTCRRLIDINDSSVVGITYKEWLKPDLNKLILDDDPCCQVQWGEYDDLTIVSEHHNEVE